MSSIEAIKEMIIRGHADEKAKYPRDMKGQPGAREMVQEALDSGLEPSVILRQGLIEAMEIVGKKFSDGEYFVPEMLMSAKAMKAGLELLRPFIIGDRSLVVGKVIIGTVKGDMHDIGKNLVAMMLEGAGFEVIDAGVDISAEQFVALAKENPEAVIGLSALLTITMQEMRNTVTTLKASGLANKIMIGGAPVTQDFANEIGADGFATDAGDAVRLARKLSGAVAA